MTVQRSSRVLPAAGYQQAAPALAIVAVVLPTLIAASEPPSITFYNQILAVFGWGVWMAGLNRAVPQARQAPMPAPLQALGVLLWVTAGSALGSVWANGLPLGLGLMAAGLALSAWLVAATAWRASGTVEVARLLDDVSVGLAWAGVVGVALAMLQVFVPQWADGSWIAEPVVAGRAVGNLRQPNHFSTLLVWAVCAAAWLGRRGRWPVGAAVLLGWLGIGAVVWTASRTGAVAMVLLALWAWRDRALPRGLRRTLAAAPLLYGGWWEVMSWWSTLGEGHAFAAAARLHDGSDISSSRFGVWANTWELIRAQPWTGVGWGEFNLAWTFSPFPGRPIAFFDHTHNLILQWAVELGVPMALLLTALAGWGLLALWWPWRDDSEGVVPMAGTVVGVAGLHSLLEYPLWYSYFLLPVAFVWALGLLARGMPRSLEGATASSGTEARPAKPWGAAVWTGATAAMAIAAVWVCADFQWAANVYAPRAWAGPLDERIASAQRRLWFGYQADYAAVTAPEPDEPSLPPSAFGRTLHNLVDARLMVAYARSLAEHGRVDHARYVVQRLREFRHPLGKELLDVCDAPRTEGAPRPFQCDPPKGRYTWREVLPH